jgi:hypothetical protein
MTEIEHDFVLAGRQLYIDQGGDFGAKQVVDFRRR